MNLPLHEEAIVVSVEKAGRDLDRGQLSDLLRLGNGVAHVLRIVSCVLRSEIKGLLT